MTGTERKTRRIRTLGALSLGALSLVSAGVVAAHSAPMSETAVQTAGHNVQMSANELVPVIVVPNVDQPPPRKVKKVTYPRHIWIKVFKTSRFKLTVRPSPWTKKVKLRGNKPRTVKMKLRGKQIRKPGRAAIYQTVRKWKPRGTKKRQTFFKPVGYSAIKRRTWISNRSGRVIRHSGLRTAPVRPVDNIDSGEFPEDDGGFFPKDDDFGDDFDFGDDPGSESGYTSQDGNVELSSDKCGPFNINNRSRPITLSATNERTEYVQISFRVNSSTPHDYAVNLAPERTHDFAPFEWSGESITVSGTFQSPAGNVENYNFNPTTSCT